MSDISQIKIGEKAQIIGFGACDKQYRRKLLSMGMTPGSVFELIRIAPLGDTIQILIRGFQLCLRVSEARELELAKVHS
jgi:ferrous iron transport protein A